MKWVENLNGEERKILNMLSGSLGLPILSEYENQMHFLADVYARIVEAKALSEQVTKALGKSK